MALILSDRIKVSTTTTGTSTYTLGSAASGFESFTDNLSNGDTTYYCCTDGTDFEVGLGTFTSSTNKLYQVLTLIMKLVGVLVQEIYFVHYLDLKLLF